MARPHTLNKSKATVPAPTQEHLQVLDAMMSKPPISDPKGWTDDVERAAIYHAMHSAPPEMALCAAGVPLSTAKLWLSDDAPESYKRACTALLGRLKEAEQACAAGLFANIHKAAQDPRYWTAAAWTLERKHGYVAQQQQLTGPATVVNIGTINVVQGDIPRISWRDDPGAIEAKAQPVPDPDQNP